MLQTQASNPALAGPQRPSPAITFSRFVVSHARAGARTEHSSTRTRTQRSGTRTRSDLFEYEYEYHFIEYEYEFELEFELEFKINQERRWQWEPDGQEGLSDRFDFNSQAPTAGP